MAVLKEVPLNGISFLPLYAGQVMTAPPDLMPKAVYAKKSLNGLVSGLGIHGRTQLCFLNVALQFQMLGATKVYLRGFVHDVPYFSQPPP